ncbi:hypothetical protein JDV02_000446 [Purpureocillium takamizusanense]|uniref:37S ribosomal protein rsm22 n=1 Tax=Purpureocillium takamizusanense TaxID=2060973 RepID=A0A9Q8V5H8_9HYPO|nr:uncharacterized protein JDV02_000446 [Purpureocillium takamizusanense]UNI13730.1 hypothetical protein JDV02_000446 [Purpureocillium takamizusanense]
MSVAIWPPVPPAELPALVAETRARELAWIAGETLDACRELKHGLEDCYALLAPVDPGSTLVMSTRHNEKVKGTLTRVGTRIVKGTLHLQLRTLPAQTISVDPSSPIHIPALDELHTHLTQSIDLLGVCLSRAPSPASPSSSSSPPPSPPSSPPVDAPYLASTLALLADSLAASSALLKGPQQLAVPSVTHGPSSSSAPPPDTSAWLTSSCPAHHFLPPCPSTHQLSVHLGLQESCVVLHLRSLEPADAPVHFGVKLGLAIGTVRRLEHDEMDTVFRYRPAGDGSAESKHPSARHSPEPSAHGSTGSGSAGGGGGGSGDTVEQVYVREKVRIESADPSLISLYSKLGYLSHMLGQTRRNLAAVMGVDLDEA